MSEKAICPVCPRHCALEEDQTGFCRARRAKGGKVKSISYGLLTSMALDPIEKKPLARFLPGAMILSVGSFGCNMRCPFCQNHDISQAGTSGHLTECSPEGLVKKARELRAAGNAGIAYTYNEPLIGYEYVRDTARLARQHGLVNVLVTNGYVCAEPLDELFPLIDAWNIDLKCFTAGGYESLGGNLGDVMTTIEKVAHSGAHLEVTTLVVPGLSDGKADMEREAAWLASLSDKITLHVTRSFPQWKSQTPPPAVEEVHALAQTARGHLSFVCTGNC